MPHDHTPDYPPPFYVRLPDGSLKATGEKALQGQAGWRSIKTYPIARDFPAETGWGPNVLLFVPTGKQAPASDCRILTGRLESDMWLSWGDDGAMSDICGEPTYWMPLPEPPE